jgi:enoyl-CoA hydratase
MLNPQAAREAGLLDRVVPPDELDSVALDIARDLGSVDRTAHAATKLRVRRPVLTELHASMEAELV